MTVTFYNENHDRKTYPKTPVDGVIKTATFFKGETDILNPVLEIAYDVSIKTKNYVYINDWNRYYFIDKFTTAGQRLFIHCSPDPLKTFWDLVMNCNGYVARQNNLWKTDTQVFHRDNFINNKLPDHFLPMQADSEIMIVGENTPETGNFIPICDDVTDGTWVLLINGGA